MNIFVDNTDSPVRSHEIVESEVVNYKSSLPMPGNDCPADVAKVLEDIHRHLFRLDLTVEEVKRRCQIGDNNISSRFRYYVGYSPSRYIRLHRLRLAKRLLRKYDMNVGEIALGVGYGSFGAFSTMFKKEEGCTPSEYRQRAERGEQKDGSNLEEK